jgi:recombinational DNA repair protein (RecF pathway)
VSTSEIISEIQRLPPSEQAEVIQFAYRLDAERMLSGKELAELAQRMVATEDPTEKLRLRQELTRGFYGGKPDA